LGAISIAAPFNDPASTKSVNGQMVRDAFPGNIIPQDRITAPAQKLGAIFKQHYARQFKGNDRQIALVNNSFFPMSTRAGFRQNQFSLKLDHALARCAQDSPDLSHMSIGPEYCSIKAACGIL
jgi:hypothetical protein